ncbi:MAG: helix-turn-helix transcriptional regulator [Myxococcales bacterium]|nr:helix-turn-helix transcriptional regulator [Myxococcales bacterium]
MLSQDPREMILLAQDCAAHRNFDTSTSEHAHYPVKLLVPLDGQILVETQQSSLQSSQQTILVPANLPHRAAVKGGCVAFFFAPEGPLRGYSPQHTTLKDAILLDTRQSHLLLGATQESAQEPLSKELIHHIREILARFAPTPPNKDPRLASIAERIRACPNEDWNLDRIASSIHLSPSRTAHLFQEHLGIPPRAYIRWWRLIHAIELLSQGLSISQAAHDSFFSDHAHLTRTMRRSVGRTPSEIPKNTETIPLFGS